MKYYYTYKKSIKETANVHTYDTREEAMRRWVQLIQAPGIEFYSNVDYAVDDQHCVAKSLVYWSDKGYLRPEPFIKGDKKIIYLPRK